MKSKSIICVAAAGLTLVLTPFAGAQKTWVGSSDMNWFEPTNWSPNGIPGDGEAVVIDSVSSTTNVLLTNSTLALSQLVISNRTLTCSNWNTTITALEISIESNGTITLPPAYTNYLMSNRVCIVCSNLTLEPGGKIDVNYKGYAGGVQSQSGHGNGPGKGTAPGGGAGHGGRGGNCSGAGISLADYGGGAYDAVTTPQLPGSGGGGQINAGPGGNGGGVIMIQAAGTVVNNGTINAKGQNGYPWNGLETGCGAGGSIWIVCNTLVGSNGTINADGGTGAAYTQWTGGGGGGGRIALIYETLGEPHALAVSALGGIGAYAFHTSQHGYEAGHGTVYLSTTGLLSQTIANLGGILVFSNTTSWSTPGLTVSNTTVSFDESFALTVDGNLVVTTNAMFYTATNSTTTVNGAVRLVNGGKLGLKGNLTSAGNISLESGGANTFLAARSNVFINCGGDLLLTNGGAMYLYSGFTNGTGRDYGLLFSVTGGVTVAPGSWIYPYSHYTDGGSCLFRMNTLAVGTNAGFNANSKGYGAAYGGSGYGPGKGTFWGGGAGYGGKGGATSGTGSPGNPYGSTNAPVNPGSGGGSQANTPIPVYGGGLVRIEAQGNVDLNGTITANGAPGGAWTTPMDGGASSGGGIFIICDSFLGDTTAVIRANGGSSGGAAVYGGGGGGGRISVAVGLTASDRSALLAGTSIPNLSAYPQHGPYHGSLSVTNGLGYTNVPPVGAAPGTCQFLCTIMNGSNNLSIAGDPGQRGIPSTPSLSINGYGTYPNVAQNTWITNTVVSPCDQAGGQQWACLGWDATNLLGGMTSDTTTQAVFQLTTNMFLTWRWTNQYQLTISSADLTKGSVNDAEVNGWYTNGALVTNIATATNTYAFTMWTGSGVPAGQESDNPLIVTMSQARVLVANFAKIGGEERVWGGTGDWTSATNWTPSGMPGPEDTAIIATGKVTLSDSRQAGWLVVSNGATLMFTNWTTLLTIGNDVIVRSNGTITIPAAYTNFQMSNRVNITCLNLTIEPGGRIDANYKGYASANNAPGHGPGRGLSPGGGAGHGGRGGNATLSFSGSSDLSGPSYGSGYVPELPGSGGGGQANAGYGGAGGGVIRINAGGTVVNNGTITASGAFGNYWGATLYSGSGSGGSIWINCGTFGGTGSINADGGQGTASGGYAAGGAGGGRIALYYTALTVPVAPTLSARAGLGAYDYASALGAYMPGEAIQGTICLSDTNLLSSTISNISGRVIISNVTACTLSGLTITNVAMGFDDNFNLTVVGDLKVQGANGVFLSGSNSQTLVAGNVRLQNGGRMQLQGGLTCTGDLALENQTNILVAKKNIQINVGGNFVLTNNGVAYFASDRTNGLGRDYGLLMSVTGDVSIAPGSWIYPYSHVSDGGSCLFRIRNMAVATNAGIDADAKGFWGAYSGSGYGYGCGTYWGGGAGHGGKGGATYGSGSAGNSYDSSNAPVAPGSGPGAQANTPLPARGGGLVRIEARGAVILDGSIKASGAPGGAWTTPMDGGASSGGGIFLMCGAFRGSASGVLRANGGSGPVGPLLYGGGGGGGRIAVWSGIPPSLVPGILDGSQLSRVIITNSCKQYFGQVSVTNGIGYTNLPPGGAEPGTAVFILPNEAGAIIFFR